MPNEKPWTPDDFTRTSYEIQGPALDAGPIQMKVMIGPKVIASVALREPGLVCVVSKPDEQGLRVEIVEPGPAKVTDQGPTQPPHAWQTAAILGT